MFAHDFDLRIAHAFLCPASQSISAELLVENRHMIKSRPLGLQLHEPLHRFLGILRHLLGVSVHQYFAPEFLPASFAHELVSKMAGRAGMPAHPTGYAVTGSAGLPTLALELS
jgi:hypothetical protein